MGLWVVSRSRIDVVHLKSFLDSPLAKQIIKSSLKMDKDGKYVFEKVMDAYITGHYPSGWRIRYFPLIKLLDVVRRSFDRYIETFREELKNPTIRKIFRNALRSLDIHGFGTPQVFADPLMIVWNYTNKCNLRCKHCYQSAGAKGKAGVKELTTEERLKVVDILAERDIPSLFFSGGEPLIEKDFFEVAEYAKKKGLYMSIATNGTFITDEIAERIADIGFGYVQVSIDAATPEKHDAFRGVPGMWQRSIDGIKRLIKHGVITCIAYTHTRENHDELKKILKLREELGAYKVIVYNYIPVGRGGFENDPTPEQRDELYRIMYEELDSGHHVIATTSPVFGAYCKMFQGKSIILAHYADLKVKELGVIAEIIGGCGAGRAYAALQPDGILTPCVYMPDVPLGNILVDDFDYLWNGHPVMKTLRNFDGNYCRTCPYFSVCAGCRARAYQYFNDFLAPDPGCLFNKNHYYGFMEAMKEGRNYIPTKAKKTVA